VRTLPCSQTTLDHAMTLFAIVAVLAGLAATVLFLWRRTSARANTPAQTGQPTAQNPDAASLFTRIPGFLCLKDADGHWLQASQRYADIFNLTDADCIGKTDMELCQQPGSDQDALRLSALKDDEAWALNQPLRDEKTVYLSADDDGESSFDITRTPIYAGDGRRFQLLLTGNRLNPRKTMAPGVFASAFYMNKLPFILLDGDFKIINVNTAFEAFSGYPKKESIGKYFVFLGGQKLASEFASTLGAWFRKNPDELWSGEVPCHAKRGPSFPVRLLISELRTQTNNTDSIYYFACLFDITKQKQDEQRIMKIAHYDDLTGLPNRTLFCEQVARSLSTALRHKLNSAVLFINIDRFKSINDSLGRKIGDELLKQIAERLVRLLRKEDIVARLSGDEFAIMCFNEQSHEKAIYSTSIIAQKIISNLAEPFHIHQQEIFVTASIGVAIFPEDADNIETLLKSADAAMNEARKQGRNSFQFFQKDHTSSARDRHQLEMNLRKALHRKELQLYYQPQYKANTQKLCGAEVLIRWLQGQTNLISPYYFIDVAEETGLIIAIGKWILETACKQQKKWLDAGYPIRQVSVNVSARQFMDPHFVETVEEALAKTRLDPACLELEITESLLIGDTKKIELQLNRLKKRGIKIALDDFGTGYSSLAYLKNFPIDVVKIDQSFVRGMTPGSKDEKIVRAIIEMGHSLGYKVVAEGVENEAQYLFLNQQGCDIIQGYYFSRPLPTAEMTGLLSGPASQ